MAGTNRSKKIIFNWELLKYIHRIKTKKKIITDATIFMKVGAVTLVRCNEELKKEGDKLKISNMTRRVNLMKG